MGDLGFLWSVIVGIIAGAIAGRIMRGRGFGCLINLVVGLLGGVLGGWIYSLLNTSTDGILGNLLMSTLGAIILLAIASIFGGRR